jgi:hypothetical protein
MNDAAKKAIIEAENDAIAIAGQIDRARTADDHELVGILADKYRAACARLADLRAGR